MPVLEADKPIALSRTVLFLERIPKSSSQRLCFPKECNTWDLLCFPPTSGTEGDFNVTCLISFFFSFPLSTCYFVCSVSNPVILEPHSMGLSGSQHRESGPTESSRNTTKWPVTFFLLWPLLVILSGVTPRSARTLAIPLASTPQLGATLVSQRRWTFILQTVRRHGEETSNIHDRKHYLIFFLIVNVIHVHLTEFRKRRKTKREK